MAFRAFDEREQTASATDRRYERLHRTAAAEVDPDGAWSAVGTFLFTIERRQPDRRVHCRGAGLSLGGRRRKRIAAARFGGTRLFGRGESEAIVHSAVGAPAGAARAVCFELDSLGPTGCRLCCCQWRRWARPCGSRCAGPRAATRMVQGLRRFGRSLLCGAFTRPKP